MQSCSFFNNTASSGGGVFTSKGAAISAFSDCKFIANRGFVFGGAMYCGGCNISRSVFTKNTASNGGAISVQEGTLYISDSNCTENIAGIGGGLSVSKSYFSASNVIFVENKATNNDTNLNSYSLGAGGGFYCVGSITTSPFGTMSFIRNSANSKLGNNYFGNGCDPISTFGCPQCESSLSNCVMDPTYGGSCTCGESNLDSQWCLTSGSMSCNGVNANDENVCSGAGECLSPDNCLCQVDRAGKNCETQRKELVVSAVGTSNCSYANPCTLDSAVRTAKAGDLIVVEDGTYVVSSSLYFPSLVNIVSRNGPKSTIIQGTAGNILFRLFTSSIGPSDYTIFSGLTFTNGTCGLYWATGSVVVQDSIFTRFNGNSEVDEYSGTIKPASNTAKLIVRRSTFLSNTQRSGAAIRSAGATVFADNVSIHNNYASAYGAESLAIAIEHKCGYQKPCGRVVISNSNIYNNSGVGPSSAIAINGGVVKMFNIKVQSNIGPGISVSIAKYDASGIISSGNGGAGIVSSSSDVTISNCTTNGNQDSGFQFWYCTGLVSDCTTYSNAGQSPGGGLEIFASSSVPAIHPLQLNNIVVFNNTAKGAGGAYCAGPVKAIVNNIQMYNNYGPNAPNLGTDNICNIWPDNCAQCSMTGSHCSASSDGCSCMPGATGPYCLLN
jgi:predicted outer membrane repeat protein